MAEASISIAQDQFSCPVCLDLLKDPVTIPCGHSYCITCITGCWDQDDLKGVYSCPQCRQTFTSRPVLGKNVVFVEIVEKLKNTKLQAAHHAPCYAGPGDVDCDICTGRKYKGVKSCVECLESYCPTHFEQHEEFHSGKRHKVTNATGRLQTIICPRHHKLLEFFCHTDQKCICMLCMMYEHKNHSTVSAEAQKTEIEKQLMETQRTFQHSIQQRKKGVQEYREAVKSLENTAQKAVEDSDRIFTELICSIEKIHSEVTQLIRDQEMVAANQAKRCLERLEREIDDLKRRDAELEKLLHSNDYIHFLQSFQALSASPESTNSLNTSHHFSFDGIIQSVCALKENLKTLCNKEIERISARGRGTYRSNQEMPQHIRRGREQDVVHLDMGKRAEDSVALMVKREAKSKFNKSKISHNSSNREPRS